MTDPSDIIVMKDGVTAADDTWSAQTRIVRRVPCRPAPVLRSNERVLQVVTDFCRTHAYREAAERRQTSRKLSLAHHRYFTHYSPLDSGRIE